MWSLEHPSLNELNKYEERVLPLLKERLKNAKNSLIKNVLYPGLEDDSILKKILRYEPKELYSLTNELMNRLIIGYDDKEFEIYLNAKAAKERNAQQTSIFNKYHQIFVDLNAIFNYKKNISNDKSRSYMISKMKGKNSCTYCNRQYTQTIVKDGGTNDKNRIARPELDHWFSKELYPLMSLSFYNLIPSCSICNSVAKGNTIFRFTTHIHPYLQNNPNPDFRFSYKANINGKWEIEIENENDIDIREKNMIDTFHLKEMYLFHSEIELKDILDFSFANNETYLDTLLNQILIKFPKKTKEDVYRMLFGTELNEQKFLDRPMSKLKYDILKKIGVIRKLKNN